MPVPLHRDTANKLIAGLIAVAVTGVIAWIGATVQGGGEVPLKGYTYVDATFSTVGTLKPREKVTIHGVRAGTVTSIDYDDGVAVAHLRLEGDVPIYNDATAMVGNSSALGKKFIDIDPGTASAGEASEIPLERTSPASDLDAVFSVFRPRVREGLRTGLQELGGGVLGHGQDLNRLLDRAPKILDDASLVTATLSDPQTGLPSLIATSNRLAGRFRDREDQIAGLLRHGADTLTAITVEDAAPLDATIERLPETLRAARSGLRAINGPLSDVAVAADALAPGARSLGNSATNLRAFLRASTTPLGRVPDVADHAVPAVKDLTVLLEDARPLVGQLRHTLDLAAPFLQTLAPFAPDAGRMVSYHDMLSGNYAPDKHFFSAMVAFPGLATVSLPDPLASVDPYPGPGGAWGGREGILP